MGLKPSRKFIPDILKLVHNSVWYLMVYPTDKDTKHIQDKITGTEGYLECTKDKEKAR